MATRGSDDASAGSRGGRHEGVAGKIPAVIFNISAPFIRRPIGTSLLAIGIFLLGAAARAYLPVASLPRVDLPIIFAWTSQPGASPETMATTVAAPLERRFGQIAGLNELTSSSSLGATSVVMQFDIGKDPDSAARDVAAAINAAAPDLPAGLPSPPVYHKANPNDAPVLILTMTSDSYPLSEVFNYADSLLAQRIAQVKGVSQVDVYGGARPAVRIRVNPGALAVMGLSMDDVRTAVTRLTAVAPKGALGDANQAYVIDANDQIATADDYRSLIVDTRNGVPITLSSVASVIDGQENNWQAAWYNKQRAVLLIVRKQADANVIDMVHSIRALMPQLQAWLSPGMQLQVQSDRTQTIQASVRDVQLSLAISIALVILVMLMFLRRAVPTAIAGITVPLSIAATFAVMWFLGYSLDNFSLMALTISVGFVVDDSIVVIENIVRYIEKGEKPLQAALRGGREIGFTVLSMSLSLIAVFIPILFMSGVVGRLFREFAVTLAVAIAVSGVVSLTLTPSLCGRFLRREHEGDGSAPRQGYLARNAEKVVDGMLALYRKGLDWSLRHSRVVLALTVAAAMATIYLYGIIAKGFFPQQDTGLITGSIEGPQDISFSAMVDKQQRAVDVIMSDPAIDSVGSSLGGRDAMNEGHMFISLKTRDQGRRATPEQVISRLRPKLARLEGVSVFLAPAADLRFGGRPGKAEYMYTLQSPTIGDLYYWVPKLVQKLKTLPQIKDVGSDLEKAGLQMNVIVDRDAASRLGLTPAAVDQALNNAFSQRQIATIYSQLNQYRVILEVSPDQQQDPSALDRIYLKTSSGLSVPLSTIARFDAGTAPLSISHQGQFPVVNISFNLAPSVSLGDATKLIEQTMVQLQMPGAIRGGFAGNAQLFVASLKTLPILIITALLTVYIVLGMLYESLIHPLTILSTLPTAGIGALLALMIAGMDLSIVSIIGIILLIGIVKKNAIMMIDFALDAERRLGLSPEEAIYQACLIRFRPIMMTSMAALFGALPLAIGMGTGSEIRQPLGVAVVGGLLLSQLLTLFTTPVVYLALERLARRGTAGLAPATAMGGAG